MNNSFLWVKIIICFPLHFDLHSRKYPNALPQTMILPHDAAMYVWEWGSGFIAVLLGVLFNVKVEIYTPHPREEFGNSMKNLLRKGHKAYLQSTLDVPIRNQILNSALWIEKGNSDELPKESFTILCKNLAKGDTRFVVFLHNHSMFYVSSRK